MSLINDTGTGATMLVQPSTFGSGSFGGWGNDTFTFLIILFLFAFMGNGWGNGFGANGGGTTYVANDLQRGFDQASLTTGINGISTGLCNGFAGVQQSLCNGFAGVNATVSNGFAQSEISANARQMADMQQQFAIQSALQNCCCSQAQNTADLKYTVATEACADRQSVTNALFDVTAQNNANTTALMTAMNNGFQSIKDQMCNDKIAAKDDLISELRQRVAMQDLASSQGQQTATILADNAAQTAQLLPKPPIAAYVVANPNCCAQTYNGCGCGVA